jgi:hypothetical protein
VGDGDLFWFKSLLVSTGKNENEHFFISDEVWAARHTPEDKPVNVGHVQHEIVGHMVGSYAVTADQSAILSDDTAPDEVPDSFHLITPGVIYRRWEDEELQRRADKIVADLKTGDLKVSMEAWFGSFDYMLEAADGARRVVARKKDTAYLTKHLRFFGGKGEYKGDKVWMLLRNLTFAGKGLVETPANPASVILETQPEVVRAATSVISEPTIPVVVASVNTSQPDSEPRSGSVSGANSEGQRPEDCSNKNPAASTATEGQGSVSQNGELVYEKNSNLVIGETMDEIETLKKTVTDLTETNKTLVSQVTAAADEIKRVAAERDTATAELVKLTASTRLTARLHAAKSALSLSDSEADTKTLNDFVTPLAALSDESFATVMAAQASIIAAAKATVPGGISGLPTPNGGEPRKVATLAVVPAGSAPPAQVGVLKPATAAVAALGSAKVDETPALATAGVSISDEAVKLQSDLLKRYHSKLQVAKNHKGSK